MSDIPIEEMQRKLDLADRLLRTQKEFNEEQTKTLTQAQGLVATLQKVNENGNTRLEQLQKERDAIQNNDSSRAKSLDREIANQQSIGKLASDRAAQVQKLSSQFKKANIDAARSMEQSWINAGKTAEVSGKMTEKSIGGWMDLAKSGLGGVEGALESMGASTMAAFKNPEMLAVLSFPGLGQSLETIRDQVMEMPAGLDTAIRGMVKQTGLGVQELGQTMVSAMDPLFAERMGVAFDEAEKPLSKIGLTADDTQQAMMDLNTHVALFRPSFMEADKASAIMMANTVAGMQKIGLNTGTSTKLLNTFTKALKQTPKESTKALKQVASIADSLGLSVGEVGQNFQGLTDNLSQYGDRMINVFGNLQAQAQATGVSVDRLARYAEGLDTFDQAASAAQGLNAVLGQSAVSVTDLVHADPADKISMIQEAIAGAGIDFETADRRMKQVIATAAGFQSVEEASKVLLNKEEAEESADALDTAAMSQEELRAKINESMTISEQMTKGLSDMAGGMTKVLDTVRPGAVKFSNVMANSFGTILEKTENSAAAVVAFQGGLEGVVGLGNVVAETLGTVGRGMEHIIGLAPAAMQGAAAAGILAGVGYQLIEGGAGEGAGLPSIIKQRPVEGGTSPVFGKSPTKTNVADKPTAEGKNFVTSIEDFANTIKERSEVPITINVQSVLDGNQLGEGQADAVLNMLTGEIQPKQ